MSSAFMASLNMVTKEFGLVAVKKNYKISPVIFSTCLNLIFKFFMRERESEQCLSTLSYSALTVFYLI
jgi:hypothetical protein